MQSEFPRQSQASKVHFFLAPIFLLLSFGLGLLKLVVASQLRPVEGYYGFVLLGFLVAWIHNSGVARMNLKGEER